MIDEAWSYTFEQNKELAKNAAFNAERSIQQLDVIFYGDSIIEQWVGTDMNRTKFSFIAKENVAFEQSFGGPGANAPLNGLALGIGGDKARYFSTFRY